MGMKLLAGRCFDEYRPMDDVDHALPGRPGRASGRSPRAAINIVVNELAAKRLGFRDPAAGDRQDSQAGADRRRVSACVAGDDRRRRQGRALPLGPRAARADHVPIDAQRLSTRWSSATTADPQQVRADIERVWKRLAPDVPFDAEFSDDSVAELYEREEARGADLRRLRPARGGRSPASACSASPPSPPSGGPRRSASARCSAPARATSSGCSPGNSPSR